MWGQALHGATFTGGLYVSERFYLRGGRIKVKKLNFNLIETFKKAQKQREKFLKTEFIIIESRKPLLLTI